MSRRERLVMIAVFSAELAYYLAFLKYGMAVHGLTWRSFLPKAKP